MSKKNIVLFALLSAILLSGYKIYTSPHPKDLKVKNSVVQGRKLNRNNIKLKSAKGFNIESKLLVLTQVDFFLEGHPLYSDCCLYQKAQRYYLPLEIVARRLGEEFSEDSGKITLTCKDNTYIINKKDNSVKTGNRLSFILRGEILLQDNRIYLSLIDIERLYSLKDRWDYNNKRIYIFKSKEEKNFAISKSNGTAAMLRLEDFTAGEVMLSSESLERMKIITDFLYSEGVKFHVSWIPRYKDPGKGIDNNLLEVNDMANAHFISILDYMIIKGAAVGLHGYTHQHNGEKSIIGVELSTQYNNNQEAAAEIIESSLQTAQELNIPVAYFESPHYASTQFQQSVIENYFDYVYEPFIGLWNKKPVVSVRNKHTIYVPTPLGYVIEDNADALIERIKNRPVETLNSFFYHPSKEFDFIKFTVDKDNFGEHTYSEASPLHKIIDTLKQYGYVTVTITQIK